MDTPFLGGNCLPCPVFNEISIQILFYQDFNFLSNFLKKRKEKTDKINMFLNIGICIFTVFGLSAIAEPDNPVVFNRGVPVQIKNQINKRPFIANRLSKDKQVREFLQGNSNPPPNPQPSPTPSSAPSNRPFDAPLPHPFDSSSNAPSVVVSSEPAINSNQSALQPSTVQNTPNSNFSNKPISSYGNTISPHGNNPASPHGVRNNRQPAPPFTQGEGNIARGPASSLNKKVSYKHDTVVFYKKECRSGIGCIKVPVLTNLKNVIFEYNQGRYSANSIQSPLFE